MSSNLQRTGRFSRRVLFVISLAIGMAAYAGLFAVAPHVLLLRPNARAPEILETFSVKLRDDAPRPQYRTSAPQESAEARPNTVQELLDDALPETAPLPGLPDETSPLPRLEERLSQETLEREFAFEEAEPQVSSIDAKILEIARETARTDLDIPRRLVRPSTERVLDQGELPSLREPGQDRVARALPPLPSAIVSPEPPGDDRSDLIEPLTPQVERPPFEEGVVNREFVEAEGLPELPVEMRMASAPIAEEIRRESPYEFMDDLVQIELDAYVPPNERKGYFRVRIAPREGGAMETLPKDVTFVVDASQSILQRKLDLTARGLAECLAKLRPEDRFNIVVFRDAPTAFRQAMTPASPAEKEAALQFISGLESRGETDVFNGVKPVVETPSRDGLASVVVVVTDGRPTTGVVKARDIINSLTEQNTQRNAIYAFGAGRTANRYLLDLLAYRNKGESVVAEDMENIDDRLPQFFERLNDPVLVDLSADYGRIAEGEIYPKELPDFYRGRVVEVYGSFDPEKDEEFVMRLEGLAGRGQKELVFKADLRRARTGDEGIARYWAFQKIYYLIGEICRVGEDPQLLAELRDLSRRYNIETSYSQ